MPTRSRLSLDAESAASVDVNLIVRQRNRLYMSAVYVAGKLIEQKSTVSHNISRGAEHLKSKSHKSIKRSISICIDYTQWIVIDAADTPLKYNNRSKNNHLHRMIRVNRAKHREISHTCYHVAFEFVHILVEMKITSLALYVINITYIPLCILLGHIYFK